MFYDQAVIHIKAGDGGNGSPHMRREKHAPLGGPDGGDGGRGGSVYLEANTSQNTLLSFRFRRHFKAMSGGAGSEKQKHGAAAKDLVIPVPPGTVVRDVETGDLLGDLVEPGQRVMVGRGGRGGLGNMHFATATLQAPEFAQKGEPGETRDVNLELMVIADVGLVGYPNAGKSSLLAAISAAQPKIASYPFTTLEPNLGVVGIVDESFVVADIPGLIEGAHTGAGLGLDFLRHVARTRVIIHVLDVAAVDGRDPLTDFDQINVELVAYGHGVADRPQIVAANKMDLPEAQERWPALRVALQKRGVPVYPISSATRDGVEPLLRAVAARLAALKREEAEQEAAARLQTLATGDDHRQYTPAPERSREFEVVKGPDGILEVSGRLVERTVLMTDMENDEGVKFLQQRLRLMGVITALEEAGVRPGDMVRIGQIELEWKAAPEPAPRRTAGRRKAGVR